MAKLRKYTTKSGETIYYIRATLPVREGGQIVWKRREISTGVGTQKDARRIAREIEAEHYEAARVGSETDGSATLFAEAAILYLQGGGSGRFLPPIIEAIGHLPLSEITQITMQELAHDLYPGRAAQTVNRQLYTPILAVLNYAADAGLCPKPSIKRPKGHAKRRQVETPDDAWFASVLPQLLPQMRALVLLLTLHGLRVGEALARTPADIDTTQQSWKLHIPDTKTGEPAIIELSAPVSQAISEIPNWRHQKWLLGTCYRGTVTKAIKAACQRAGIPYYGTHAIGRHAFAIRALRDGYSLKWVMQAGRWKDSAMPMKQYGHFENSEISRDVQRLSEKTAAAFKLRDRGN